MTEFPPSNSAWASFCLLIQQLIAGHVRRNTFSQWEMELLLDLQMAPMRKSARPDVLRRYLKAIQQQLAAGGPGVPLRFSRFFENETRAKLANRTISREILDLPRAS